MFNGDCAHAVGITALQLILGLPLSPEEELKVKSIKFP